MSTGLKLKTAQLRRQHILDAAVRAFAARGYRGTTIRDIAAEAGVADGTVYNVFENKEALLLAILEGLLRAAPALPQSQLDQSLDTAGLDAASHLKSMLASRWEGLTPDVLAMMRIIWSEALTNRELAAQYRNKILKPAIEGPEALFQDLADRGAIEASDVPVTLRIIVASFLGLTLLKLLGDDVLPEPAGTVPQKLAELLTNGLLPRHAQGSDREPA